MGMSNPSSPSSDIASKLDQRARDYEHNPIQHIILNPFQNSILLLRAKYATYESITTMLNEEGVKVSEATVRKFCRTHQQEVKRLRAETDRRRRETNTAPGARPAPTDSHETPPSGEAGGSPSTSTLGKPGPKIAREKL